MSEARRLHVAGIGSMAVDRVHRSARILGRGEKGMLGPVDPEEGPAPVRRYVGGVVLNHLGWAAALGLRCGIFGRMGDDEGGRFLRAAMERAGIAHEIDISGSASTVAEIFVDDEGERSIYMAPGATSETTPAHIHEHFADFIASADRISTEVSQLPLATTRAVLERAREAGIPTVVDFDVPASDALATLGSEADLDAVLRAADLLKPAKIAARELFPELERDALALARAIRERYGNAAVVVTDGEQGCAIAAEGFEGCVPAVAAKAVDTTGAGDAFLGGLLVALARGLDWQDAGRLANACGAACVEQLGAFPEDAAAARARVRRGYDGPGLEVAPGPAADVAASEAAASDDVAAAMRVLDASADAIAAVRARCDGAALLAAAELIEASRRAGGRVHVTGVGKPEHVSHYVASLLSSTGTPATFLHTTEALHGSFGQVCEHDVVIAISNSGGTAETVAVAEAAPDLGARVIAVTGRLDSPLARAAEVVLDAGAVEEGGPLGLAPRASIAVEIAVLAALSALLQERQGFDRDAYALRHPAGALGRQARGD